MHRSGNLDRIDGVLEPHEDYRGDPDLAQQLLGARTMSKGNGTTHSPVVS